MIRTKQIGTEPRPVVGYVRISAPSKNGEGVSLESQTEKIYQYAVLNNAKVLQIFSDEGISGTKGNRPGVNEAINLACKEKAVFVVYSLSRFSRSITDTVQFTNRLDKAGAELVSLSESIDTTSATGKMVFRMIAVINQFQCEITGEYTRDNLHTRKSKGLKNGGKYAPFGYTVDADNKLIKDPTEQKTIRLIKKMAAEGYRVARITRHLNTSGIPAKKGIWYDETVKKVLNSSFENSRL